MPSLISPLETCFSTLIVAHEPEPRRNIGGVRSAMREADQGQASRIKRPGSRPTVETTSSETLGPVGGSCCPLRREFLRRGNRRQIPACKHVLEESDHLAVNMPV